MSMKTVLVVTLALLTLAPATMGRERGEDELRRDMEFARQQVFPALVNISVVAQSYAGGRSQRAPAAGSGVIVSPAGHVVTNYHVAGNTSRIVCRLPSKESIEASVVAHDPMTDITILKLKLETRKDRNSPIPFARIGDSSELMTGDYVLAMGNPMTLSSSMTLGIVGNPTRVMTSFTGSEMQQMDLGEGQLTGTFTRWIQHDALILPGNSGGPLVNLKGEVIGINELGGSGMAFAIPSNLVKHVLNQALAYGEVIRGWVGVTLYPVEKMGGDRGALVASVQRGGPAWDAGLRAGDVIVALDGKPTNAVFFDEIPLVYKQFADYAPGKKVKISYLRGSEEKVQDLTVTVKRMETYLADEVLVPSIGLVVRDITGPMALLRRYPSADGVLISSVRPGKVADLAKPKLRRGDVIVELDGKPSKDVESFKEIVGKLGKRDDILVRLRRAEQSVVTVLDTKDKKKPYAGGELPKAWIGIRTQVLTPDVAKALGLKKTRGFRVTQVFPDTEARKAGLKVGDILTGLNGKALRAYRTQDSELLTRKVESLDIDSKARFTLIRDGSEMELEVVMQESPRSASEVKSAGDEFLEFKVREITFGDRIRHRWNKDQKGLVVTEVTGGGWASLAGLRGGDLIRSICGVSVTSIKEFRKTMKQIRKDKKTPVSIFVTRGYRTAFIFIQPDYE